MSSFKTKKTFGPPELLKLETEFAATGRISDQLSPDHDAFRARVIEGDARRSEAICMLQKVSPLSRARTYLARGKMVEARSVLNEASLDGKDAQNPEILLEDARLAAFEGNWSDSIRRCNEAILCDPSAVTRLTLHQVRSVAWFESLDFQRAAKDIETVRTLTSLFPAGPPGFYAEVLEIKILAHTERLNEAQRQADALWISRLKNGELGLDAVLFLLRADLEILRMAGSNHINLATGCKLVARALGNSLYEHLADLDILVADSNGTNLSDNLSTLQISETPARVAKLIEEVLTGAAHESATARSIRAYLSRANTRNEVKEARPQGAKPSITQDLDGIDRLLVLRHGVLIDLRKPSSSRVHTVPLPSKIRDALAVLSKGAIDREKFFQRVWRIKRYSPHLHDDVIQNVLYRIKRAGIGEVRSNAGILNLPSTLVV